MVDRIEEPRTARSRRTRAAILDATWTLIEEQGAEDLSMEEVAERAGVSRRAIYLHFPTRAELLVSLMAHMDRELDIEASLRPVLQAPDGLIALKEFTNHLASYHPRILAVVQAVDRARRSDEAARALWDRAMEAWHRACRTLVERIAEEGRLSPGWSREEATDLLWALMSVDLLEDLTVDRGWSPERYGEALYRIMTETLTRELPG
jgi:AcrR family transcriptional regulator